MKNPEEEKFGGQSEQKEEKREVETPAEIGEDFVMTVESLKKQLENNKFAEGGVTALNLAINNAYEFLHNHPNQAEHIWYRNLFIELRKADRVMSDALIERIDLVLWEKEWDKKRVGYMKETIKELNMVIIPRLEDNGEKQLVEKLQTSVMAIEMKLKADGPKKRS